MTLAEMRKRYPREHECEAHRDVHWILDKAERLQAAVDAAERAFSIVDQNERYGRCQLCCATEVHTQKCAIGDAIEARVRSL